MSGGPGFYRGTTHDQTPFFANKEKKMIESKKWPSSFSKKVDISKVSLDVMKPWISKRITELLGVEDEIVIDYCMSQLRPAESAMGELSSGDKDEISPKRLQINLTGFMAKSTGIFVKELWELLLSAQENPNGIPQQFLDEKKEEMQRMKEEQRRLQDEIEKRQEIYRLDNGNLDGPRRSNFSDALIIDTTTEKENDSSVKASKMEEKEDLSDTAAVKLAVEKETKAEISHKDADTQSVVSSSRSLSDGKSNHHSGSASASDATSRSSTISSHSRRKNQPHHPRSFSRGRRSRSHSVDKYRRERRSPNAYRRRERNRSNSLVGRRWKTTRYPSPPRFERRRYNDNSYQPDWRRSIRQEPRGYRIERRNNAYEDSPPRYGRGSRYVDIKRRVLSRRRISPRRASPARRRVERDRSVSRSYSRPSSSRSSSRSVTPYSSASSSRASSASAAKQRDTSSVSSAASSKMKKSDGKEDRKNETIDFASLSGEEGSSHKKKDSPERETASRSPTPAADDAPPSSKPPPSSHSRTASASHERDASLHRSASPVARRPQRPSRDRSMDAAADRNRGRPRTAPHRRSSSYDRPRREYEASAATPLPPRSFRNAAAPPRSSAPYYRRDKRYSPRRESRSGYPFRRHDSPPRRGPPPSYHGGGTYTHGSALPPRSHRDGGDVPHRTRRGSPRRGRRESVERRRSISLSNSRSASPRSASLTSSSASPPNGKPVRSVNLKKRSHSGRLRAWSTSSSDKSPDNAKIVKTIQRGRKDDTEEISKKTSKTHNEKSTEKKRDFSDSGDENRNRYSKSKSPGIDESHKQNGALEASQRTKSEETLRQKALHLLNRKTQNR